MLQLTFSAASKRLLTSLALLVVCLLGLAPSAWAQRATVRGFVTDNTSNESLQGASVVLRNADGIVAGTATDGDGYFILNRLPADTYTLEISFIGYGTHTETITLTANERIQRTVVLVVQEAGLEELVVEGDADAGVTAVAAGLQTVQPAQVERVPMPGVSNDLAAYLQTVPGVVMQGDRGGQFFVRGGAVDQNLVYLDGVPVYMPFHIVSFYSAFPQEILDSADLYTGGFGARYGSRMSSVFDVQTRNGNKQNFAGSVGMAPILSAVRLEGPIIKDRVSIIGSVRQSLFEEIMPTMFGQRLPYRFGDRFGKIHAFLNANNSFSFTALHSFDEGDIAGTEKTFLGDFQASEKTDSSQVGWDNLVFGGRYVHLSNYIPLLAEIAGGYSEMTNDFGPRSDPQRESSLESIDVSANFTYFLGGGHEFRFGGSYRDTDLRYSIDDGQFEDLTSGTEALTEINSYAEFELGLLANQLTLQPGVNVYMLTDRSQQWVEPRVRAFLRPSALDGRQQFSAAWGVYHQAIVGLNDERDIGNLFTAWVTTPEDAPTPQAMHAILGWNMQITPSLSVATEAFYKDFENLSVPIFSAFPQFTTELQPADGQAMGMDFRVDFQDFEFFEESVLDGYVSYSLSHVEYEAQSITYNPPHDRRHQINVLLHAEKDEIGFTLQWQYGSGLPFTKSGGFDIWMLVTPDLDVTEAVGTERVLYGEPYGGRQPVYNRVDLWLERRRERGRFVGTLRAGAINVFNRDNLFYFDLFTIKRIDQLPVIPSIGFKLEWR